MNTLVYELGELGTRRLLMFATERAAAALFRRLLSGYPESYFGINVAANKKWLGPKKYCSQMKTWGFREYSWKMVAETRPGRGEAEPLQDCDADSG